MQWDILVVEDHPLTAEGVTYGLTAADCGEVATAGSLAEARRLITLKHPAVIILDLVLPDGDGIDFFEQLAPPVSRPVGILLSGMLTDADIQRALAAGFQGILTKTISPDVLSDALGAVVQGKTFYSPDVLPIVASLQGSNLFTPRMLEVLRLLQDGLSNKQIAASLEVSEATVSFHVNHIKLRLGARTNRQILSQLRKLGISLHPE